MAVKRHPTRTGSGGKARGPNDLRNSRQGGLPSPYGGARTSARAASCPNVAGLSARPPGSWNRRSCLGWPLVLHRPSCSRRWWAWQRSTRLPRSVRPPSDQCTRWWAVGHLLRSHPGSTPGPGGGAAAGAARGSPSPAGRCPPCGPRRPAPTRSGRHRPGGARPLSPGAARTPSRPVVVCPSSRPSSAPPRRRAPPGWPGEPPDETRRRLR